jgi:hypothetical protein
MDTICSLLKLRCGKVTGEAVAAIEAAIRAIPSKESSGGRTFSESLLLVKILGGILDLLSPWPSSKLTPKSEHAWITESLEFDLGTYERLCELARELKAETRDDCICAICLEPVYIVQPFDSIEWLVESKTSRAAGEPLKTCGHLLHLQCISKMKTDRIHVPPCRLHNGISKPRFDMCAGGCNTCDLARHFDKVNVKRCPSCNVEFRV